MTLFLDASSINISTSLELIASQQKFFNIKTLPLKTINSFEDISSDCINIKEVFSSAKYEFGKKDKVVSSNCITSFKEAVNDAK